MILITKPTRAPASLRNRGATATRALRELYDVAPDGYRQGTTTFQFDAALYNARSVKDALIRAQHGKCCFCESKVTHIAYGDVEHFRPKAGYWIGAGGPLGRPGYYWLAYEWSNLLFCCQLCNQRHKKNHFPLANPFDRAICHHDDLGKEVPLFINPAETDPSFHLEFRGATVSRPKPGDLRGAETISALGLNRPELVEVRLDYVERLVTLRECHELLRKKSNPTKKERAVLAKIDIQLRMYLEDSAPFTAMARAVLADFVLGVNDG